MRPNVYFWLFFFCTVVYGQDMQKVADPIPRYKPFYSTFELAFPLISNPNSGEINPSTGEKAPWYRIDGIQIRGGFGTHYKKWIGVGVNTGIDWSSSNCIVIAPLYTDLRISPKIGNDIRLVLDMGYGRSLTLGGSHLSGHFRKISLGIGDDEFSVFVQLCDYGFSKDYPEDIGSFSFGINASFY